MGRCCRTSLGEGARVSQTRRPPLGPAREESSHAEISACFGEHVRRWRGEQRLSLEQLAERAELGSTFLQRIELGGENPSLATLHRLAAAMDTTIGVLFSTLDAALLAEHPDQSLTQVVSSEACSTRERLAAQVRTRRSAKQLTQDDLATRAGVSRSKVQSIESARHAATIDTLDALALALGCDAVNLLDR